MTATASSLADGGPVSNGGSGAPVSNGGDGAPVSNGGDGAPVSNGGSAASGRASGVGEPPTPYRVAARQLLRDSLFDAARGLLQDRPWAQITMSDVARAAGVSRQTLYKELGTRDGFAQQFVIREGARFLDAVEAAILAHLDDPRAAVTAGLEVFLRSASEDPLVGLLLSDDGTGGMLPLITTQSRPVLEWASQRLRQAMRSGWPDVREEDAELLADTLVRLALSYIAMPRHSPHETAAAAATLLEPAIQRALGNTTA